MTASHGRASSDLLRAHPDVDGHYHIDGVPPGRFVLIASAPGRTASQWLADVLVDAGRTTIVDWILTAGASVSGLVIDSAGRALPGVPIQLERIVEWDAPEATGSILSSHDDFETRTFSVPGGWRVRSTLSKQATRTDEQGRYSFQTISPGLVRISVMEAPAGLLTPEPSEFTVADLQHVRDVDFAMHRGVILTGRVRDDMGRVLRGARAQVSTTTDVMNWNRDLGVSTDAGGYFEIGGLSPERELILWVTHAGFADHLQEIRPGKGLVEVQLMPSVMLTCLVLASETGLPLRRYEVVITQDVITRSREISTVDGRFALELDDDIPVSITISAPGRMTTTLERVRPSDTLLSPLKIMLPPGS